MTELVPPIREGLFVSQESGLRLITGLCDGCRELHFPRTDSCPYCGDTVSGHLAGPDGVVTLSTIVRRPPPGYGGPVPYGFGIVKVGDTRLEVVSRLTATDSTTIEPGMPVRLTTEELPGADGSPAVTWAFRAVEA